MTLEQIKHEQNLINENLYQLLKENTQLIDDIAGQEILSPNANEVKEESPQGLIEEILLTQNRTNALIRQLYSNNSRLYDKTHMPVEVTACAKVSY